MKYFIDYTNHFDHSIKPLPLKLPKLSGSAKRLERVKYMSFMLKEKHKDILIKYSKIWNRTKDLTRKDFDIQVIHNDEHISVKIKSSKVKIFHDDGLPPGKTPCATHSIRDIELNHRSDKSYRPLVTL